MIAFLSSTCYDLADLRAEIENALLSKNYSILLSDRANFPLAPNLHRHDACIENVKKCDLFILVIDGRFGGDYYKDTTISITWAEFREALNSHKKIIAFVRRSVFNERQLYKHNLKQGIIIQPYYTKDLRTFDFLDEVQKHQNGVWCQPFDNSVQVKEMLNNLYETNHSLLNQNKEESAVSFKSIYSSSISKITRSFLEKNLEPDASNSFTSDLLEKAIKIFPEDSDIALTANDSDDFFYISDPNDDAPKIVSTTALGKSVKSELKELLQKANDDKFAKIIFTDTVKRVPILSKLITHNNESYIIGIYERSEFGKLQNVCILKTFANRWSLVHVEELDENALYAEMGESIDCIICEGNLYFYFKRRIQEMGTMFHGFGVIEYILVNINTHSLQKLIYMGKYRGDSIEGNFHFRTSDLLQQRILEEKARDCEWIYRTPPDYNIDDEKNCIEKWHVENPDFYNNERGNLNLYYYDNPPFGKETEVGEDYQIENELYLIWYYFAGPAIVKKKSTNQYFILWSPQNTGYGGMWGMRSIHEIKFLSNNKIFAKTGLETYEFELNDLEYERTSLLERDEEKNGIISWFAKYFTRS